MLTRSSGDPEIARYVSRWMQRLHFSISCWSSSVELGIQVGYRMQVATAPTYPVIADFRFLLYSMIAIYQHYRQMDGHYAPLHPA